jgi:hypothetical protein
MVYIPTQILKKLGLCILLLPFAVRAQPVERQLAAADSLFQQKLYTQALQQYRAIEQQGFSSDAMLLRMAFIEEGLGHTAGSVLYLNRFWLRTGDGYALEKIRETAAKQNWRGYDYSATDRLHRTLFAYRDVIIAGGLTVLALLLPVTVLMFRKKLPGRTAVAAANCLVALTLGVLVYLARPPAYAVVAQEPAYLMTGPSGASRVLARIGAGHRIPVNGVVDVWIKTEWQGVEAYVRQSHVRAI